MKTKVFLRAACLAVTGALVACGPGGGGSDGADVLTVVEMTDPAYPAISDRGATGGPSGVTMILLQNGAAQPVTVGDFDQSTGVISSSQLAGLDLDNAEFQNPADAEFSRIARVSGTDSFFGAVGFGTAAADRPEAGSVTAYVDGWAGLTATTDAGTYTLTGDATFTADWGSGRLRGDFTNLDGTVSDAAGIDAAAANVGTIRLSSSVITGSAFAGGIVTGTGLFSGLDGNSSTVGTSGNFFGPQADELGGLLVIDDPEVA
ncbi:MAG: transferrin-binding protein-like solute binding protein, partial [Pseudomonadota bacterium]